MMLLVLQLMMMSINGMILNQNKYNTAHIFSLVVF